MDPLKNSQRKFLYSSIVKIPKKMLKKCTEKIQKEYLSELLLETQGEFLPDSLKVIMQKIGIQAEFSGRIPKEISGHIVVEIFNGNPLSIPEQFSYGLLKKYLY